MTTDFTIRLFGPGLPGGGAPAQARWQADLLEIELDQNRWQVRVETLTASGFNAEHWRFDVNGATGDDGQERYTAFIETAAARAAFVEQAPGHLNDAFAKAAHQTKRLERGFRLGWLGLGFVLLLPVFGLIIFLYNSDSIANWVVKSIPIEQEKKLGDLVLTQTRMQMKLQDQGLAVEAVRTIGEKLTIGSRHQYRWFIGDSQEINAFAAPGGVVVVLSGLIAATNNPEELAGVLAHEVSHAELRHSLRATVKNLGLRGLLIAVLGDFSAGMLGDLAAGLTEMKFSRDAEREADHEGLKRLTAAKIDPGALISFFEILAKENRLTPPVILSTHPATGERIESIRREMALLDKVTPQPLALDWPAIKASLAKTPAKPGT